jgi:dTDP-4-amino-4,6-dideoxygalactose transaminase
MRRDFLPFALPTMTDAEIDEVVATLRSGWITTGPRAKRFEHDFAAYVGAPYAVAVTSGTAALHLALAAIGLRAGDEVIIPVTTFTATAEVVRYFDAHPVFVDIDADTYTIDVARAASAITARTRAIIPVHMAGQPCDMDPLLALARAHGVAVIEDAAHALPARYKGRCVGTLGDLAAFSFYATKPITTAEGGMVTTASPDYAQRVARMSLHGISTDAWKRYSVEGSWFYEVEAPGYKYNMPDLAAALGLVQLRRCDALWSRRATIAARYDAAFAALPEIATPVVSPDVQHAWHLYIVRLDLDALDIDRAGFIRAMHAFNIGTSVHFIPLHLHPYYRRTTGHQPDDFPVAMRVYPRVVSLPIYPSMSDGDVADVIDAVRAIVTRYRRRRALAGSGVAAGEASWPERASASEVPRGAAAESGVPRREAAVTTAPALAGRA